MALKTTGLKKRKKKGPPSLARPPKRKYPTIPPGDWNGKPVGPGRPKKPPVGVKPGPGKPDPKKPKKPPQYQPPGKKPVAPPKHETKPRPIKGKPIPGLKPKPGPGKGKPNFGGYVKSHPDLAAAFKKHKAKGGTGTAASWGKRHYEKHGKKEKRKLS